MSNSELRCMKGKSSSRGRVGWWGGRSTGGGSETRFIPSSLKELAVPVVQGPNLARRKRLFSLR